MILFFVIFLTRTNLLTNQQFINNKQFAIFPFNLTLRKYFGSNNYHINLTFSRKRRQSNNEFKSDSLKYFTCARVRKIILKSNKFFVLRLVTQVKMKLHLHLYHVY